MAKAALKALEITHFNADGQDDRPPDDEEEGCARACYDCLLSYTNQPDHKLLDRHLLRATLLALAGSSTRREQAGRSYEKQYQWLRERTDPASELERQFLDHLYQSGRRLPDYAQPTLADYPAQPDFYYQNGQVCVFCDGSVHDQPRQQAQDRQIRGDLTDMGYRVVVIRYDRDLEEQVGGCRDVFGQ